MKKTLTRSKTFDGDLPKLERRLSVSVQFFSHEIYYQNQPSSDKQHFRRLVIHQNLIINVMLNIYRKY
jgi:hypothetical protein